MEIAILGLGCFWGPEIKFSRLDGIIKTEVGYCGGNNAETNYKEVCSGTTNHAEVVKLDFDPKVILTTVAKGKFLKAINIDTNAINPAKHLLK